MCQHKGCRGGGPVFDGTSGRLVFSLMVTAPVPEPATWAMMIAGFGLTGGAMRRRTLRADFA